MRPHIDEGHPAEAASTLLGSTRAQRRAGSSELARIAAPELPRRLYIRPAQHRSIGIGEDCR